jgi:hypothetical protein
LHCGAQSALLYHFTLSNARRFHSIAKGRELAPQWPVKKDTEFFASSAGNVTTLYTRSFPVKKILFLSV